MNPTEVIASELRTGKTVSLRIAGSQIESCSNTAAPAEGMRWLAPSLVDVQVNGYGGIDFQADALTESDLLKACRGLRAAGCGRFLLTLITDDWTRLKQRLAHLKRIRDGHPGLRRRIAGWHIEGPFLSDRPGYHGAHEPQWMLDPSPEKMEEIRHILEGDPVLLTLAPERQGSLEAIRAAVSMGIRVSLGHTDAPAEVIAQAVEAGATGFTHLGNGCPQQLDRHDNIVWRVLNQPGLTVGFIPDRVHVSPAFFRVAHKVLPPESIYYVSDAMSAAGCPPGRYPLGALSLEVGADQIVRRPGTVLFAGSALRPIDGVFRAAGMLGEAWQKSWMRFTDTPARWMGMPVGGELERGDDQCLITIDPEGGLQTLQVLGRDDL